MTDNPIADALRERMATPENDTTPTVKDAERQYVASRIALGGEYVRTESTKDGRTVFAIAAPPEDVKSYNDMFGEHVRAGIYIGDDNQVSYSDNPLTAGLLYGSLTGNRMQVIVQPNGASGGGPCDDPDCTVCHSDPTDDEPQQG